MASYQDEENQYGIGRRIAPTKPSTPVMPITKYFQGVANPSQTPHNPYQQIPSPPSQYNPLRYPYKESGPITGGSMGDTRQAPNIPFPSPAQQASDKPHGDVYPYRPSIGVPQQTPIQESAAQFMARQRTGGAPGSAGTITPHLPSTLDNTYRPVDVFRGTGVTQADAQARAINQRYGSAYSNPISQAALERAEAKLVQDKQLALAARPAYEETRTTYGAPTVWRNNKSDIGVSPGKPLATSKISTQPQPYYGGALPSVADAMITQENNRQDYVSSMFGGKRSSSSSSDATMKAMYDHFGDAAALIYGDNSPIGAEAAGAALKYGQFYTDRGFAPDIVGQAIQQAYIDTIGQRESGYYEQILDDNLPFLANDADRRAAKEQRDKAFSSDLELFRSRMAELMGQQVPIGSSY